MGQTDCAVGRIGPALRGHESPGVKAGERKSGWARPKTRYRITRPRPWESGSAAGRHGEHGGGRGRDDDDGTGDNPVLESQFPNVITAPATDVSTQPFFWSSFNIAARRQQRGGWAREVTQADFAISDEIAGVNMYLEPGGIRELHWHETAEWAIMTAGKCRITTSQPGRACRASRTSSRKICGFCWPGCRTRCRASRPDGAEFVLAFDDGAQSESNTLLLTDWFAHTPPDVLAKNFAVAQEDLRRHPPAQPVDLPRRRTR